MKKRRAVVTGIGVVSPLGNSVNTMYEALKAGQTGIRPMPEWQECFGKVIGAAPVTLDAAEVKSINRKVRRTMGNAALFAGLAAKEAVEHSRIDTSLFNSGRVATVIGSTVGSASSMTEACLAEFSGNRDELSAGSFFKLMSHSASFNVADMFGINGVQLSPCSACASGLQSVGSALELIQLGKADVCVTGGTDETTSLVASSFQMLYALAERETDHPELLSRPFDADREGLICSEGAGILILEELEHALARNAQILFEVIGYATNCSGWHVSHSDEKQIGNCMLTAMADAGISPADVDYISAHATGTVVGDRAEAAAIAGIFGDKVPVSSLKGHLGHTLGASGALELGAVAGMMADGIVLPTRNLQSVSDCAGIWLPQETISREINCFIKNSVAFGGVNTSLICRKMN